jgi:hypothetical protein
MPPLPVIADTFRVALLWNGIAPVNPVNVFHVHDNSGTATASDVNDEISNQAAANMWLCLPDAMAVGLLRITPLDGTSPTVDFTPNVASRFEGQQAGQYSPQVACLEKFTTDRRGPANRGRMFLGPVSEGVQVDGVYGGAGLGLQQTAWENFVSGMTTAGFPLCVASYKHGTQRAILAVATESTFATQKRRQNRLRS